MPDISAVDAIYLLLEKVDLLDKKISIVDTNVKLLSNKISKISSNSAVAASAAASPPTPSKPEAKQSAPARQQKVEKLVLGNCKAYGYIVSKAKLPIEGVSVNIFDESSSLIKSVSTNSDGHWEVRLPPGRYGVEYIHKNFKPINRTITLTPEDKNFEVR